MNDQASVQFNLDNFQRIEIDLSTINSDQNNGVYQQQVEGDFLFVERCDYPVLLSLTAQKNALSQCEVVREGDSFKTPFRGITISYPKVGGLSVVAPSKLVLIVGKNCAQYENSMGSLSTRMGAATRVITNSAVSQQYQIHVPPGLRRVVLLEVSIITPWTTMTAAPFWVLSSKANGGGTCANPGVSLSPSAPTQVYVGQQHTGLMQYSPGVVALTGVFSAQNLVLPDDAAELGVNFTGTGLTAPNIRVVFQ